MIRQGDLYWLDFGEPEESEPGYRRPFVVIQNDLLNTGRIATVIVASVSTSLRRAGNSANALLNVGEANLPRQSVVVVSQVYTVNKSDCTEYIGTLSPYRVRQILVGLNALLQPTGGDE